MVRKAPPRLLPLPEKIGPGGRLGVVEGEQHVPFAIRRVFYVTDMEPGLRRGGHAHKGQSQGLIALAGALTVTLDDGRKVEAHRLDRPDALLYVPPMLWLDYVADAAGAVLLVLASDHYDEGDYIRDRAAFDARLREMA
jgi:dTDP-4-dehydrorhamnose 3,5-epimerase-like enzyme